MEHDLHELDLARAGVSIQAVIPATTCEAVATAQPGVEERHNGRCAGLVILAGELIDQRAWIPDVRSLKAGVSIDQGWPCSAENRPRGGARQRVIKPGS